MQPRRIIRTEEERNDSGEHLFPILASETARNAASAPHRAEPASKSGEEKVSMFWRIFGGTILSIAALVVITAYQSIASSMHELRTEIAHANEARAEMVKKDEFQTTKTKTWDRLQEIQKDVTAVQGPVNNVRDRITQLEEANKSQAGERKDMHELHATIKERVAQFEQRLAGSTMTQKDVQMLQAMLSALQEKSAVRDQQLKQMDDERKEMLKEIQSLRERMAKMEAAKENGAKPNAEKTGPPRPMPDPDQAK